MLYLQVSNSLKFDTFLKKKTTKFVKKNCKKICMNPLSSALLTPIVITKK